MTFSDLNGVGFFKKMGFVSVIRLGVERIKLMQALESSSETELMVFSGTEHSIMTELSQLR